MSPQGYKLFEKLKALRLTIARDKGVPPYIVFDDKCLIDMACKAPTSKEDMLKVSGVGLIKLNKYGD